MGAREEITDDIESITDDNERVRAALVGPDGLTRIAGDEQRRVACTVVMVVTDRRVLFVAGTSSAGGGGGDAGSLAYADLAAVAIKGEDPAVLTLSTANGVRWEFQFPDGDSDRIDAVVRHLRWIGELRSRVVACRNDVELAAGEIRDHAAGMEWDEAESVYGSHRTRLDRLIGAVQVTEPIADAVVAPELTDMGRTLERGYARLYIERAQSQLELAQQLVENEDYDQARKALQTAEQHYERASDRADAVERGDAFRFGEQRDLRHDLDRLEWEIETVAAEPIRQAHEAKIRAKDAPDRPVAVERWETAFRRYQSVLELEWDDGDRHFSGDREEIREQLHAATDHLVEGHRTLAREKWDKGVTLGRNDAVKSALRACTDARDHLDRAAGLAAEFRPDDAAEIERRQDGMERALQEMRDTATVDDGTGKAESDGEETASESEPSGAASALRDIDTHQDLRLDATVQDRTDADQQEPQGYTVPDDESDTEDTTEPTEAELSERVVESDETE